MTQRFEQGGFVEGDFVKFRPNVLQHEKIKSRPKSYRDMIVELGNSNLNLRISAIKPVRSVSGQVGGAGVDEFLADVGAEAAAGVTLRVITVPLDVLELVDEHDQWPKVPDGWKYDKKEDNGKVGPQPDLTMAQDSHRQLKHTGNVS